MNSEDTLKVCEMLVEQIGVKPEDAAKAISLWQVNMRTFDYQKAQEALKALMMQKTNAKTAGGWLASITAYCNGSVATTTHQKIVEENPGCDRCRFSGCIEVPHCRDWAEGRWKGMYTMVVACNCAAGQLKACQISNIGYYESRFPQWREEYPRRKVEKQLREMDTKEPPTTKKELAMYTDRLTRLLVELDFLNGEVPDLEVSH